MFPEIRIGSFVISTFSFLIAMAVVCFLILSVIIFEKLEKIDRNQESKLIIVAMVGIAALAVFAMAFNTLFHSIQEKKLVVGGITWEGGLIGAFPITLYFIYKYCPEFDKRPSYYLSLFIPQLVLGHCIGRIGCFCAGCCYGSATDSIFGISFPAGSEAAIDFPGGPNGGSLPVYPTQLFEALFEFVFFIVLMLMFKKYRGHLLETYMIGYGIFRFFIEYLRGDDRGSTGVFLTPSQLMSIALIIGGILIILYHKGKVFKQLHKTIDDRINKVIQDEKPKKKIMLTKQTVFLFVFTGLALFLDFVDITYSANVKINQLIDSSIPLIFGSGAVFILVLEDEKNIFKFNKPWTKYLFFIPCLIIAVDNFPFISYFNGNSTLNSYGAIEYILFAVYCLSVGTFEELLFRGLFYKIIAQDFSKDRKGFIKTYVVSSVVFGLAHLLNLAAGAGFGATALQICYSTLIGGLCAFALIKTRNIFCCILTHGIYDFCGLLLTDTGLGNGVVFDAGTTICMAIISVIVGGFILYTVFKTKDDEIKDFYDYIGIKE